jgi:hypothetical protein
VPLRHHRLVIARDRLQSAAAFIAQLHRLSAKSPHSWRRAESVGRDVGLADADLEQAIRDAEKAGLIQRRADDEGLIIVDGQGAGGGIAMSVCAVTAGSITWCWQYNPKSVAAQRITVAMDAQPAFCRQMTRRWAEQRPSGA